ncbi:FAD-dependent oxidoreductase [Candidatus Fermentibacterales bacterium]|nr:FAD-dependent oxidoreductase [Candidatus Fermentibacterales bacterium]
MPNSGQDRLRRHPILSCPEPDLVPFGFDGRILYGRAGEMVSSALFANGVQVFGHHEKDSSAQGMFCANGQCSQCTLIIDGIPLKSCIVPLREGMDVRSVEGIPRLEDRPGPRVPSPAHRTVDALIIGAGPAGLAAAIELGKAGASVIVADDKDRPGGKLVLQTHKFFGSEEDCYAGTRGIDIAGILATELQAFPSVEVWLETVALAVYSDGRVCLRRPGGLFMIEPRSLLTAAGARERSLVFPGNTLAGVYGAGAFQTLVNRDLVRCAERIFVVGGGNVGLIAAYHAIQAGMTVVGLAEALDCCSGYKVHADKIRRLGVPIYTRHSVVAAHGSERLEAVTIAGVDDSFSPVPGTETTFAVDTLLIAVGLESVREFHEKALAFGMRSYVAGDAEEIAEASAAMFTGRIRGMEMACDLGLCFEQVPPDWGRKAEILKSPGGEVFPYEVPREREGVFPVLHCTQEIPCNPCMTSCPKDLIRSAGDPILGIPVYDGGCIGCERCVAICPGLAVTLVDFRKSSDRPVVTVPYELGTWSLRAPGQEMVVTDWEGEVLGSGLLRDVRQVPGGRRTVLLRIEVDADIAARVAGVRVQDPADLLPEPLPRQVPVSDLSVVCRCERVTAGEIREHLRAGIRDLNQLKALTRAGFGACGGKTCRPLLRRLIREEGIPAEEITDLTERPLFAETRLGMFSGTLEGESEDVRS